MNLPNRKTCFLYVLGLLILMSGQLFATIDSTAQSGNWNDPNTWSSTTVPSSGDTVYIVSAHVCTLNVNASPDSISIRSGATLLYDDASTRTLTATSFNNDGTVEIDQSDFLDNVHSLTVSGNFYSSGTFSGVGSIYGDINLTLNGTSDQTFSVTGTTFSVRGLTFSGAGTKTGVGTTTVSVESGNFTIAAGSGTYTVSNRELKLFQAVSLADTVDFIANGSTVTLQGGSQIVQSNADVVFHNLTVNNSGLTLRDIGNDESRSYTINGTLRRTSGAITLGTATSLAYGGSASLVYNGSSSQTTGPEWTSSVNPDNVTVNNSSDVIIAGSGSAGDRELTGNLTLTSGELRHAVAGRTLLVDGNIVGGSGEYGVTTRGTIELNGSTSTSITISESFTVGNLEINKTSSATTVTVVAGGNLVLDKSTGSANSNLTVTQGTFVFSTSTQLSLLGSGTGNHNLTIAANGTLRSGGVDLSGFDSYTVGSGKIVFNGSSIETLPTGIVIGTVEVDNSAGVLTDTGTLTVSNSLILTDGIITTTSTKILLLDVSATIAGSPGSSSFISGPLRKAFTGSGSNPAAFDYPVGSNSDYRPANFDFAYLDVTDSSIIEIEHSTDNFTPKGTLPDGIDQIDDQTHYILQEVGTTPDSIRYTFRGTFEDGNFTPETRNNVLIDTTGTYSLGATQSVNSSANTATGGEFVRMPTDNGFVVFGRTEVTTEVTWDGGGSDDFWSTAANWSTNTVPGDSSFVTIASTFSVLLNSADSVANLTLGDGSNQATLNIIPGGVLHIKGGTPSDLTVRTNSKLIIGNNNALQWSLGDTLKPDSTNFQSGSFAEWKTGNLPVDTYGNLTINGASGTTGSGTINVLNNCIKDSALASFTAGNAINVTGNYTNTGGDATYNGGLTVSGSQFTVSSGVISGTITNNATTTTVNTGGSFTGTVTFSGSSAQTIGGTASPVSFSSITFNNSNGITCNAAVRATGTITFTDGLVNTTTSNLLTVSSAATVGAGSSSSYINGPFAREGATGTDLIFPIGKSNYRPITTNLTGTTPTVRFEVFDQEPYQGFDAGIDHISTVRFWKMDVSSSNVTGGTINITYGADDAVTEFNDGDDLYVVVSDDNSSDDYTRITGGSTSGSTPEGNITSGAIGTRAVGDHFFTLGTNNSDVSLPVALSYFDADISFSSIRLKWITESELNNSGFNVYRKEKSTDKNWQRLNTALITGQGNTSSSTDYEFIDQAVTPGVTYLYSLESVSYSGNYVTEQIIEIAVPLPDEYLLFSNYPNPFNPTTNLKFQLPADRPVSLLIYDINGHLVRKLLSQQVYPAGEHVVTWDATDNAGRQLASGQYFYQFRAGDFVKTGKMLLLK